MMKRTLRIALAPFMLTIRLLLGLAAFVTSIASSVLGLTVGLFALLGVVEFAIGLLAERYRLYGPGASGESHRAAHGCGLPAEPNGSHPRFF